MSNAKKVDCALLPPCSNTVDKKLKRAHLISIVWGNADSAHPGESLDPQNFGWKEKDGYYDFDWYSGPSMPDDLFDEEDETQEDYQANVTVMISILPIVKAMEQIQILTMSGVMTQKANLKFKYLFLLHDSN